MKGGSFLPEILQKTHTNGVFEHDDISDEEKSIYVCVCVCVCMCEITVNYLNILS